MNAKRLFALMLALVMATFVCALGEETEVEMEEEQSMRRIRLGSSVYTVMIGTDYMPGELTDDAIAAGQIGCWRNEETGMDVDFYQLPKADDAVDLGHYTLRLADREETVEVVWPTDKNNDIDMGWYWASETVDDEKRPIVTYVLDSGDSWLKLVFHAQNDEAGAEIWTIMDTVDYMTLKTIPLGDTSFTLLVPGDYMEGEISDEDIADDQVAYWYSDESLLDFDVYVFSKEGEADTLAAYTEQEAATYPAVSELVTDAEINLVPVAWYQAVDECDEGEYDTITYVIDGGDQYLEVVFWLDGPTAKAEADFIIHNLIDESMDE